MCICESEYGVDSENVRIMEKVCIARCLYGSLDSDRGSGLDDRVDCGSFDTEKNRFG